MMKRHDKFSFDLPGESHASLERAVRRQRSKAVIRSNRAPKRAKPSLPKPIKPTEIIEAPSSARWRPQTSRPRSKGAGRRAVWHAVPAIVAGATVFLVFFRLLGVEVAATTGLAAAAVIFVFRWYATALHILMKLLAVVIGALCFPVFHISFSLGETEGELSSTPNPNKSLGPDPTSTWALVVVAAVLLVAIVLLADIRGGQSERED